MVCVYLSTSGYECKSVSQCVYVRMCVYLRVCFPHTHRGVDEGQGRQLFMGKKLCETPPKNPEVVAEFWE